MAPSRLTWSLIIVAGYLIPVRSGVAFEANTHSELTVRAVSRAPAVVPPVTRISDVLRTALSGFPDGVDTRIDGAKVVDWMSEGSIEEDDPVGRVVNHFHDPTREWDQAGFDAGVGVLDPIASKVFPTHGMSSILWGQHAGQSPGDSSSWSEARASYYRALTRSIEAIRDAELTNTLMALGHLMHLIQDAASPAHTRNDPHPFKDTFHEWGKSQPGIDSVRGIDGSNVIRPADDLLMQTAPNAFAPIAIARLIDNSNGNRSGFFCNEADSGVCGTEAGIAEYSNAKFLSDDRKLSSSYASPKRDDLDIADGYFYFKAGRGEPGYRVGKVSFVGKYVPSFIADEAGIDNQVMADYARQLFPRAVGYSAALVEYFFRGTGLADGSPALRLEAVGLASGQGTLTITNASNEDLKNGSIEIWYDNRSGERVQLGSPIGAEIPNHHSVTIGQSAGADLLKLWNEGPLNGSIVVVYNGSMGDESDVAVAARACQCPAKGVPNANDPGSDCFGVCGCRYLAFGDGDPGAPGDGLSVVPSTISDFGNCGINGCELLSFQRPVLTPPYFDSFSDPNGFAIAIFPGAPAPPLRLMMVQNAATDASCSFCQGFGGSGFGPLAAAFRPTTLQSVAGTAVPFDPHDQNNFFDFTQSSCCCGASSCYRQDDIMALQFCFSTDGPNCGLRCHCNTTIPVDAVAICPGQGAFPTP